MTPEQILEQLRIVVAKYDDQNLDPASVRNEENDLLMKLSEALRVCK